MCVFMLHVFTHTSRRLCSNSGSIRTSLKSNILPRVNAEASLQSLQRGTGGLGPRVSALADGQRSPDSGQTGRKEGRAGGLSSLLLLLLDQLCCQFLSPFPPFLERYLGFNHQFFFITSDSSAQGTTPHGFPSPRRIFLATHTLC